MDVSQFQSDAFKLLKARFSELGFETESMPGTDFQIGDTLVALLPVTENDDRILTDLRFVKLEDEIFYVQIFSTVFADLEGGCAELEKALPALNYYARFGAYGMFPEKSRFWHKYCFAVRDFDRVDGAEGFAVALLDMLDLIRGQNSCIYEVSAALATGELTYDEAVRLGKFSSIL